MAANDKRYTVSLNPANGKYEFTSLAPGGGTKSFNTRQEAINAISAGNGGIKSFSDGQTAATTPVSENEKVIQQYKDEIKLMQDAQNVKDEENRNFMTNMFNTMTQQQAASA